MAFAFFHGLNIAHVIDTRFAERMVSEKHP